jgi:hypothetical protein
MDTTWASVIPIDSEHQAFLRSTAWTVVGAWLVAVVEATGAVVGGTVAALVVDDDAAE